MRTVAFALIGVVAMASTDPDWTFIRRISHVVLIAAVIGLLIKLVEVASGN